MSAVVGGSSIRVISYCNQRRLWRLSLWATKWWRASTLRRWSLWRRFFFFTTFTTFLWELWWQQSSSFKETFTLPWAKSNFRDTSAALACMLTIPSTITATAAIFANCFFICLCLSICLLLRASAWASVFKDTCKQQFVQIKFYFFNFYLFLTLFLSRKAVRSA